jgi:hypothetical protein
MTAYRDAVLEATEEAAKHHPPIHASAQREFVASVQAMKARGEWVQHPDGPVTDKGENLIEFLARTLKAKPVSDPRDRTGPRDRMLDIGLAQIAGGAREGNRRGQCQTRG